ncbi:unnamed protein product [Linum tenue]|uniref:MLO-like protein n=1 Tax=Linum tenue TaxID=586396 RepID=A0AAV0LKG8_9ROSI|nr:unnamed protein product [Linum tenue]
MLLGFISLMLTAGTRAIPRICISHELGRTMLPCSTTSDLAVSKEKGKEGSGDDRRKLLSFDGTGDMGSSWHRMLAGAEGGEDYCSSRGKVPLISVTGVHQLHIFVFVLAVFHIMYCVITMTLGRAKVKKWKTWESETSSEEYQFTNDPTRFRLAHQTSFVKRHSGIFAAPGIRWVVAFFRQFTGSITKVDYLTMRNGFINILLVVGTKLELVIMDMAQQIQERSTVVKGAPIVEPDNRYFWFNRPHWILLLLHYTLFQNAFQMAYLLWNWYEFKFNNCFRENKVAILVRVSLAIILQFICSYITFPLYSLVTQMGSNMKQAIFEEQTAKALRKWQKAAQDRKKLRQAGGEGASPLSSGATSPRPFKFAGAKGGGGGGSVLTSGETTPSTTASPVHLLHNFNHRSTQHDIEDVPCAPYYHSDTDASEFESGGGGSDRNGHVDETRRRDEQEKINQSEFTFVQL